VFAIGYGWHGELGQNEAMQADDWIAIDFFNTGKFTTEHIPIPLRDISLGLFHSLFLPKYDKTCFYAVGRSTEGQSGANYEYRVLMPTKVILQDIRSVFATEYSSFFITGNLQKT
jgi:alpha-tubulin suppressor-like RCC1 family protein